MNVFLDTEFTGLHKNTTLISIALVAQDGTSFYAELNDYDKDQVNDFIQKNVIGNLLLGQGQDWPNHPKSTNVTGDKLQVRRYLTNWLNQFEAVTIWSDTLAYDWVLFCDLLGDTAFDIPKNVFYIPLDIATLLHQNGDADVSREEFAEGFIDAPDVLKNKKHNALWDAYVIKACYDKIFVQPEP